MKKFLPLMLGALIVAACSPRAQDDGATNADADMSASATPPAPAPATAADPAEDAADPADPSLDAPTLTPEAQKGETGARNILLEWARALENKDFARAYAQWGDDGERSGMSQAQYRRQYAKYDRITVTIGLGTVEGAAGSLYYQVPVTLTGTLPGGDTETLQGPVTVRRVNDVDGASAEQLRWHLEQADLKPASR